MQHKKNNKRSDESQFPLDQPPTRLQIEAMNDFLEKVGKDNIMFCQGRFYLWENRPWRAVEDLEIKQKLQRHEQHEIINVTSSHVESVFALLRAECFKADHVFSRSRSRIPFENGVLSYNGKVWSLRPHRLRDNFNTCIPIVYDTDADAPRFRRYLREIFQPDIDWKMKVKLVLEAIGYTLLPSCRFHKFFLLIGPRANGKSVLLHIITKLVGDKQVAAVQPNQFGNKAQRAHLNGKLANIVTEISTTGELPEAEIKAMVCGDPITAEAKYKDPFEYNPVATLWLAANEFPSIGGGGSMAFFRRAIVIPFNRVFLDEEQDTGLKEELEAELPGILNMALRGLARLITRDGFDEPESCQAATKEWQMEANHVLAFVEECCQIDSDAQIASRDLYEAYRRWCNIVGIGHILFKANLTKRLKPFGVQPSRTSRQRLLLGITLKTF